MTCGRSLKIVYINYNESLNCELYAKCIASILEIKKIYQSPYSVTV